tara:strand:+ start:295 stop:528 length:234 start_codon:yes stop_codon:yes gene_type:complete
MNSSKSYKRNPVLIKQIRAASIVWLIGIALIIWSFSDFTSLKQLVQIKYIPIYIISLLSAAGLGWFYYSYWQKNISA